MCQVDNRVLLLRHSLLLVQLVSRLTDPPLCHRDSLQVRQVANPLRSLVQNHHVNQLQFLLGFLHHSRRVFHLASLLLGLQRHHPVLQVNQLLNLVVCQLLNQVVAQVVSHHLNLVSRLPSLLLSRQVCRQHSQVNLHLVQLLSHQLHLPLSQVRSLRRNQALCLHCNQRLNQLRNPQMNLRDNHRQFLRLSLLRGHHHSRQRYLVVNPQQFPADNHLQDQRLLQGSLPLNLRLNHRVSRQVIQRNRQVNQVVNRVGGQRLNHHRSQVVNLRRSRQ